MELNLVHLCQRAVESGDWKQNSMSKAQLLELLNSKIDSVNIENVKEDIIRFIQNPNDLEIWSKDYFKELINRLKVVN